MSDKMPVTYSPESTEAIRRDFVRELSAMPFGGLVSIPPTQLRTLGEIVDWVANFRAALTRVVDECDDGRAELNQLRADLAAVRRVLGTQS